MEKTFSHAMGVGISIIRWIYSVVIKLFIVILCRLQMTWMFFYQRLVEPTTIERWAVVNFSARCQIQNLINDLIKCGGLKGIVRRVIIMNTTLVYICTANS